jgi:small-conductance mechanosensitive channel
MNAPFRACLLALLLASAQAACAESSLEARARELRRELAQAPGQDRRALTERQLLTSLERREDLSRAREDARRLANTAPLGAVPPPKGLLAVDALRRELQQMDQALASGRTRLALLRAERIAAAGQLEASAAKLRRLQEQAAPSDALDLARLEAQLAESTVAEMDLIAEVVGLQERRAQAVRAAAARRLSLVDANAPVGAAERAALVRDIDARQANLQLRLAEASRRRDAARATARAAPGDEVAGEALANLDIDMELTLEALADLVIEREAWALALRFRSRGDVGALADARERGPALHERLQRRREFLLALDEQLFARIANLQVASATALSPSAAKARLGLQAVLQERLDRVQGALQEEHRLSALLQRLREDFDQRASTVGPTERLAIAWSALRSRLLRAWNLELFSVIDEIEVEGRRTQVPRAITLGKLVQAPLLLLAGSTLVWWLTGWGARWLQRRRGLEEARVRLLRRWVAIVLLAACGIASLVLAGIPLAAFAFVGGAVAIGAGIGTQALFKNLLSGVLVLVERPFRLGDVIEVEGLRGTVVDIDLRASVLRDDEGAETLVPNATLIDQKVRNMTSRSRRAKQSVVVEVNAGASPRDVMEAMRGAAARHGQLLEAPAPEVLLDDCDDGALRFALHYWLELRPGVERKRIASDLRLMVLGAFEEAGIALAPRKAA